MKRSQMGLFYKAITIVSFLSIALVSHDLHAVTLGASSAKQIGFRVANQGANSSATQNQGIIDQPPVVIQGRSGNAPQQQQAPARAPNVQSSSPSMAMEPVVEGFGDKVPLTVAIQQILPQGYGYTLGDGVDAGQLVSWRGGRPWTTVLQDMLGQSGLGYSVNGRSVAINGNGSSPAIISGTPGMKVAMQPVIQPVQQAPVQAPVVVQQPVMMDPQPVMVQQPVMMQAQPQQVMMQPQGQQQMVMMQPQPQMVMQPQMQPVQPMMQMQQPVMVQQPVMMQQPVAVQQPMQQVVPASTAPQPLQIENPMVFQSQTWEARPGQTLRALLQEWCTRVGVELNWTAEFDYPVMASMNMTGTFEEAVRVLLTGFDGAKPTPRGRLHYNPAAGQSILIVEADGNHYGD